MRLRHVQITVCVSSLMLSCFAFTAKGIISPDRHSRTQRSKPLTPFRFSTLKSMLEVNEGHPLLIDSRYLQYSVASPWLPGLVIDVSCLPDSNGLWIVQSLSVRFRSPDEDFDLIEDETSRINQLVKGVGGRLLTPEELKRYLGVWGRDGELSWNIVDLRSEFYSRLFPDRQLYVSRSELNMRPVKGKLESISLSPIPPESWGISDASVKVLWKVSSTK